MSSEEETRGNGPRPSGPSAGRDAEDGSRLVLYKTWTRASVGELAAGVVHDMNNPLQVMMLHLELLQTGRPMPNWIEMFGQQVQRISALTNRLRDFAHVAARDASVERIDVNGCIEAALKLMKDEFQHGGITVECLLCRERVQVLGNAFALQQALLELFLNAREAMGGGGVLRVETGRKESRIVLRISDSGPGVPAEIQDEVFKPFVTTKGGERAGIGLAICARTVAHLRGEIRLEEGGGGGAAFQIVLPAAGE